MKTVFLLLAKYDSPRLSLVQMADFMDLAPGTVSNRCREGRMPFAVYNESGAWWADLSDVAEWHDRMADEARSAMKANRAKDLLRL